MPFFSRVVLPLLLFIYIAVETYLKLNHSSLCEATGCKLAGQLLRFNPLYLNYLGLGSMFVLTVFGYASLKSKLIERLFFMVLYAAIAFEATILGYQFIANPEPCVFCLSIFSTLSFMALLGHVKNFPIILAVALSIFLGLSTLSIGKNKPFIVENGYYLIQSKACPHCKKVKTYFNEENIKYTPISVQEASARHFLKFSGINTIPVLVIKEANGVILVEGDKDIIDYFKVSDVTTKEKNAPAPIEQSSVLVLPSDLFSTTSEPGCAITITETPDCEKSEPSH